MENDARYTVAVEHEGPIRCPTQTSKTVVVLLQCLGGDRQKSGLVSLLRERHEWHLAFQDAPALPLQFLVAEELDAAVTHGDLNLEHVTRREPLGGASHLGVGINATLNYHNL
jgi:hypothetical protein